MTHNGLVKQKSDTTALAAAQPTASLPENKQPDGLCLEPCHLAPRCQYVSAEPPHPVQHSSRIASSSSLSKKPKAPS